MDEVVGVSVPGAAAVYREARSRVEGRGALVFGDHDAATMEQVERVLDSGASAFVECADGHKGYAHPIGGVAAYEDKVSLSGVGYDIGCGNLAIRCDADAREVRRRIAKIMDEVASSVEFGMGRKNDVRVDHALFDDEAWKLGSIRNLKGLAQSQLGTVGSGNHFCDIFEDEEGRIWVGVHFGSRGFGHKCATHFLHVCGARDSMDAPPALLDVASTAGAEYLEAMRLAGEYAAAGREWVGEHVVRNILGAREEERVHNHHNFAWREEHGGRQYYVVRKGATPAFPGQRGFIGGSMGDDAVIVEGVDSELSRRALYSTVHGAGRVMSRTAAKGKRGKPGLVNKGAMAEWLSRKGVCLRGGDLDEAPQAYRRLPEVLRHHEGTIRVLHVLSPLGVVMAGSDVTDLYKD